MLGAASGILFGVSDVGIKALTGTIGAHGLAGLADPWLAVTVLASIVAFFSSAKALQDGEAVPVIAVTSTAANVSGIVGGLVVFGDPFPTSGCGHRLPGRRLRARDRRRLVHARAHARGRRPRCLIQAAAEPPDRRTLGGRRAVPTCTTPGT